jgi:hypothetical protein
VKPSTRNVRGIVATIALVAAPSAFAAGIGAVGVSQGTNQPIAGARPTTPLKGAIRLNGAPHGSMAGAIAPARVTLGALQQKYLQFNDGAGGYESALKNMPLVEQKYGARSYSVQDQMAAGCNGSESLNQCMDKLYKHCVQTWGQAPDQHPGVSSQAFQQSATAAAAEARALSLMLERYAAQAEQNVKKYVP